MSAPNCTELDAALGVTQSLVVENDLGFLFACLLLLGGSFVFLVAGERIVRPAGALVGGLGGAGGIYVATAMLPSLGCETRLVVAAAAGILAAALIACVVYSGIFVLGAAAAAVLAHLIHDALPLSAAEGSFALLGRSGWYYVAMFGAVVGGAVLAHVQRKQVMRVGTALLGAGGVAFVIHLGVARAGEAMPTLASLVILVPLTVAGSVAQWYLSPVQQRLRKEKKEAKELAQVRKQHVQPPTAQMYS